VEGVGGAGSESWGVLAKFSAPHSTHVIMRYPIASPGGDALSIEAANDVNRADQI
jgi:hypothetical protein